MNINTGGGAHEVTDFNEPTVEVVHSKKDKQGRKSKQNRPKTSNTRARASSQPRAHAAPRNTPFQNGNLLSSKPKQVKSRVMTNNQSSTRHGDALMAKEYSNYL